MLVRKNNEESRLNNKCISITLEVLQISLLYTYSFIYF